MKSFSISWLLSCLILMGQQLQLFAQNCNAPTWNPNASYSTGAEVVKNGKAYQANYWSEGSDPENSVVAWDPWSFTGNCGTSNQAPSASIVSPSNGQTFTSLSPILIQANASDSDGSISSVTVTVDGTPYSASLNGSYYEYSWTPSASGNYTIEVVATDNQNATSPVASISITVQPSGGTLPVSCTNCVFMNRWTNAVPQVESNNIVLSYKSPTSSISADKTWQLESVSGQTTSVVYIKNGTDYAYRDNGDLKFGALPTDASTAHWEIITSEGDYFYIRKPNVTTSWHMEYQTGEVEYGTYESHWWSSQWSIKDKSELPQNIAPEVQLLYPATNQILSNLDTVEISILAQDPNDEVQSVTLTVDGQQHVLTGNTIYTYKWKPSAFGTYSIDAFSTDQSGTNSPILHSNVTFVNEPNIVLYEWPIKAADHYDNEIGLFVISSRVDHGSNTDYNHGNWTYGGHNGTDIGADPFGWVNLLNNDVEVIAMAPGVIIERKDGNYDLGCGSSYQSSDWNVVTVEHADGTIAMYGHLRKGTVTSKQVGDSVQTGEKLGTIGSSGGSGGPHLHLEIRDENNNVIDPFSGPNNQVPSRWKKQLKYLYTGINWIGVVTKSPYFSGCVKDIGPAREYSHEKETYFRGEDFKVSRYYTVFQGGSHESHSKILYPDGSVFKSWTDNHKGKIGAGIVESNTFTIPSNAPAGTYTYVEDYSGETFTKTFTVSADAGNKPSLSWASPSDQQSFTDIDELQLNVNASDADGTVQSVLYSYYDQGKYYEYKVDGANPFSLDFKPTASGTFTIFATPIDDDGLMGDPQSITISMTFEKGIIDCDNCVIINRWTSEVSELAGTSIDLKDEDHFAERNAQQIWDFVYLPSAGTNIYQIKQGNDYVYREAGLLKIGALPANTSDSYWEILKNPNEPDRFRIIREPNTMKAWHNINDQHYVQFGTYQNGWWASDWIILDAGQFGSNIAPEAEFVAPFDGQTLSASTATTIQIDATDIDGSIQQVIVNVEGQNHEAVLNGNFYEYAWTPSASGTFNLSVYALDDKGSTSATQNISVTVSSTSNVAPTASITAPTDGQVFTSYDPITVTVDANDTDGTISEVELVIDGQVYTLTSSPYAVTWTPSGNGAYGISAFATDNQGATSQMAVISITVNVTSTCTTPAWSSTQNYNGGDEVSFNGTVYRAKWWTNNEQPDQYIGDGLPWEVVGSCTARFGSSESESLTFQVLPNPANDMVTVSFNHSLAEQKIRVISMDGIEVLNTTKNTFSVSELPTGIYLIHIQVQDEVFTQRLVVE